jgi:hypothetical protein
VSLKGKSLLVMTPMYGGVNMNNYFMSCLTLKELMLKHEVPHAFATIVNESLITRARNRLADIFQKTYDHTHGVYIDSDIGFEATDILRMLEMDLDIVGAPCSRKEIRWDRLQRMFQRNHRRYSAEEISRAGGQPVYNPLRFEGQKEISLDEPFEVEHLGTGIMMIRRNVFETIAEANADRWYESGRSDEMDLPGQIQDFFRAEVNPETRKYDSEDYVFCRDARAAGFKIWLCPWMCTTHMGTYSYTADLVTSARLTGEIR